MSVAFFLVGFASFSLIYCAQPLLTQFTVAYHVSPTQSALALSVTTGLLAFAILLMSAVADRFTRRSVLFTSMVGAALLTVAVSLAPTWPLVLLARAAVGLVLGGVPAVAMAALAEVIDSRALGRAMGVYVGGTAFGGMIGRVGVGAMMEVTSWRVALAVLAGTCLLAAVGFRWLLPATPRADRRTETRLGDHVRIWWQHLSFELLQPLFVLGFLNLGVFVAVFNYLGFRLTVTPYHLSHAQMSLLFAAYLFGVVASPLSGAVADRFGRAKVVIFGVLTSLLGLLMTLAAPLTAVVLGVILMTCGFFVTHAVVSGWVGLVAPSHRGHASALYLLAYYLGSSIVGLSGGLFWSAGGWSAVAGYVGVLLLLALRFAVLARRPRSAEPF